MTSRQRQKILILLSLWQAGGTEAWRFCLKNLSGSEIIQLPIWWGSNTANLW